MCGNKVGMKKFWGAGGGSGAYNPVRHEVGMRTSREQPASLEVVMTVTR